jgi:transcription initiation factor TFIID subunit 7
LKADKKESENKGDEFTINVQPLLTRIKLHFNTSLKTPLVLKAKVKGRLLSKLLREGYDSEASDREDDSTIEEGLILQMSLGDDCEYL